MSNYLIKLTPTGKYFFGGDMTFSVGKKEPDKNYNSLCDEEKKQVKQQIDFNTRFSSYIINSEKFPQQTSLLGMLRFFLLRNSSLFDGNKIVGKDSDVTKLIGKTSFMANGGEKNEFGIIKELSPCFLMKGSQIITRLPMDYKLKRVTLNGNKTLFVNGNPISLETIISGINKKNEEKQYSAKNGIDTLYGDAEGNMTLEEKEIFIEDLRVGISRNVETGHTEDDALFKQVNYRLADDFCFAFYAQIDKDISEEPQLVSLGADSSQFIMRANKLENIELPIVPMHTATDAHLDEGCIRVVLISPSLIDKGTITLADYAMTEVIPFRHMTTNIKIDSYHRLSGIKHSEKIELFQTGSVFYFKTKKNADSFKARVENYKDFHQIGYNHCQETK